MKNMGGVYVNLCVVWWCVCMCVKGTGVCACVGGWVDQGVKRSTHGIGTRYPTSPIPPPTHTHIRTHTVEQVLKWVDEEGGVAGVTVADCGCGTGERARAGAPYAGAPFGCDVQVAGCPGGRG